MGSGGQRGSRDKERATLRRHAKASAVGSNSGLGHGLGFSRPKLLLWLCLGLALAGALTASPALAVETHPYTGISFGPKGPATNDRFTDIGGVAVDPANGNVYVYDSSNAEKIYKFDSAGNPVNFSGLGKNAIEGLGGTGLGEAELAVAPPGSPGGTAGDIYYARYPTVTVYGSDGTQLGELTSDEACGVATNAAGHVFVGHYPSTVREYVPSANPVKGSDEKGASSAELSSICNVAADGLGNVYATNYSGVEGVFKLEGLGAASPTQLGPGASLAVDPATNDVYIDSGASVAHYDSSGTLLNTFASSRLSESVGIAVNGASGNIYIATGREAFGATNNPQRVEVYGPLGIVPGVKAEAASAIGPRKATLNGTVNPDGFTVSECKFEYGTTTEYGKTAPCEGSMIPTDSSDHPVSAAIAGLSTETTYHYRLVATNANGTNLSADETLKTANAAFTMKATGITGAKATLNGAVFPEGETVDKCEFEYGITTAYGKTTPCIGPIPTDENEHPVSAAIGHLVPNGTEYHFRLAIERAGNVIQGADEKFKTEETAITGPAGASSPTTATITGTVNPEGTLYTECKFEYGPKAQAEDPYASSIPCAESPATIGEGSSPVSVHADLSGLTESTYHYRLVAINADGTANGKDSNFGIPLILQQQPGSVTDTEAELIAYINPNGLTSTYHLEYGIDASYGQSTPETFLAGSLNPTCPTIYPETGCTPIPTASELLAGLKPDTTYHWRAVATNGHGTSRGPDRIFTTYPTFVPETNCPNQPLRSGASAALPDCRAYEMVSPSQKAGEVFPPNQTGLCPIECLPGGNSLAMPMQSAPDGEAVVFQGQPFSAGLSSSPNEYLARRSPSGWGTQSLSPPQFRRGYQAFSPDLARAVIFHETSLSPEAPSKEGRSYPNLYLRDEGGSPQPLVINQPPHRTPFDFKIIYAGANSGTASNPAFSHVVFEANDSLTDPTPSAPAAIDGGVVTKANRPANLNLYEWLGGQLRLVNVMPGNAATAPGAVIGGGALLAVADASRENYNFDHAISDDGSRIFWSDESSGQVYVRIDGKETQKVEDPGVFLTASSDGSKVLLNDGCLYDLEEKECQEDLTKGQGGLKGILGTAEDLSSVYFVDTAVLTGGEENTNEEQAEAGEFNLYGWQGGATTFIAVLLGADNEVGGEHGDWRPEPSTRTAQASTDGRYLAFMSQAPLTDYDNTHGVGGTTCNSNLNPTPRVPCNEVFEYDAVATTLTCVSCNPSGRQPIGPSRLSLIKVGAGDPPFPQPGNLSPGGQGRLFFESWDVLSLGDTNGSVLDIYQWEPSGVGGCKRANGCVSLISSGHSPSPSLFVDSTPSGNDAFFVTREQLLLRDKDEQIDLYNARVGGGISEAKAPPCLGEACRGPVSSAPDQQSPGSSSFAGPGNEKPKKTKKQKKRRKHKSHHKRAAKHDRGGSK
jgi:hypothetical protein